MATPSEIQALIDAKQLELEADQKDLLDLYNQLQEANFNVSVYPTLPTYYVFQEKVTAIPNGLREFVYTPYSASDQTTEILTFQDRKSNYYIAPKKVKLKQVMDACIAYRRVLAYACHFNGDWEPDWNDISQLKFTIERNKENTKWKSTATIKWNLMNIYCKSEEITDNLVKFLSPSLDQMAMYVNFLKQ